MIEQNAQLTILQLSPENITLLNELEPIQDIEKELNGILNHYLQKTILKLQSETVSNIKNYYVNQYTKKFGIPTEEKFLDDIIFEKYTKINSIKKNKDKTLKVIEKIITWYLYVHNNKNQNDESIPYQLNILMKQDWLFQKAIEGSSGLTIEDMMKPKMSSENTKSLQKSLKRGDVVVKHQNAISQVEELLMRIESLDLEPQSLQKLKQKPKIRQLYNTDIPDLEYIEDAKIWLDMIEQKFGA